MLTDLVIPLALAGGLVLVAVVLVRRRQALRRARAGTDATPPNIYPMF